MTDTSSIREAVARAIAEYNEPSLWDKTMPTSWRHGYTADADAAITAFLEAAAAEGWHMRPDEATEEMKIANCELDCGYAACHKAVGGPQCVNHGERQKYSYESWIIMVAAAPRFEDWDK